MQSTLKMYLSACLIAAASLPSIQAAAAVKAKAKASSRVNPRGEILALSCSGCHGTDGKSAGIIPSFYGKSPEYLESALKDFKSGARVSTVMGRHAKGYSDEDIHLIAEYFGTVWKKHK